MLTFFARSKSTTQLCFSFSKLNCSLLSKSCNFFLLPKKAKQQTKKKKKKKKKRFAIFCPSPPHLSKRQRKKMALEAIPTIFVHFRFLQMQTSNTSKGFASKEKMKMEFELEREELAFARSNGLNWIGFSRIQFACFTFRHKHTERLNKIK